MERLPYIDQRSRIVAADRERTWAALLRWAEVDPDDHSTRSAGFVLDEADPPRRVSFAGRNRFTRYRVSFHLDDLGSRRTRLTADSHAAFRGRIGKVYRALVIGTGGHALAVRYLLFRIATAAAS